MTWDWDYAVHFGIGFGVDAASSWPVALLGGPTWIGFPVVVVLGVFGTVREWRQHRDDEPVWTPHRVVEAAAWPLGALVAAGVGLAF